MKLANTLSAILFCLCTNAALAVCTSQNQISFNNLIYCPVVSEDTGRIWLDRNLGARQVATSVTDNASYGYLYQWGRNDDGHEIRTSELSTTRTGTITPNNGGKFIRPPLPKNGVFIGASDWVIDTVDESGGDRKVAWASGGANSVCPPGYRVPTIEELEADTTKAGVTNSDSAFSSFLKLTMAGNRYTDSIQGTLVTEGQYGTYWSSTPSNKTGRHAFTIYFTPRFAIPNGSPFNLGHSVRCISAPDGDLGIGTNDPDVELLPEIRKITAAPNENRTYSMRVTQRPKRGTIIVAASNNDAVRINSDSAERIYGSTTYSLKFTFTSSNWLDPQIITIDTACAGESATITHSIIENDDYKGVVVPNVAISISEKYDIDIDGNGSVNAEDAKRLTQYLFGTRGGSQDAFLASKVACGVSRLNVDNTDNVNTKDGTLILRRTLGVDCPNLTANQTSSNCVDVKNAIELLLE